MMNETIYEYQKRIFLGKDKHNLSALNWSVYLTEQYLNASLDVTDGEKNLYFNGFLSAEEDLSGLDEFKLKMMNIRDNIDDLLHNLETAEEKLKELNGK